jgi:hypothetical protein
MEVDEFIDEQPEILVESCERSSKSNDRFLKTITNDKINFHFEASEADEAYPRWGRENDKILFKTIRELELKGLVSLDHLLTIKVVHEAVKDGQMILLANQVNWIGPIRNLARRIKSLSSQKRLSVRENKLLKRIVRRDYKDTDINYDKLLDEFPGRSQRFLEPIVKKIKKRSKFSY